MANFGDKITVVVDFVTEKAKTGIKSFRQEVSQAEGVTGKLKAGAGSLASTLGGMGPAALAGAATAAGAAALSAVNDFSELGVEVGKFSDATGLTVEESSRWIEVAGDLGIEVDALQSVIGRLNKSVDPELFKQYGIEIVRAGDGTVDANATFLNTLDVLNRMKDPVDRAKAGAKLFGKGWQQVAELVGQSAGDVRKRLEGVSDAKVFDAEKVAKARRYRDAMDDLHDALEDVAIQLGTKLAPAIADAAETLAHLGVAAGPTATDFERLNIVIPGTTDALRATKLPMETYIEMLKASGLSAREARPYIEAYVKANKLSVTELESYTDATKIAAGERMLEKKLEAETNATDDAADATKRLAKAIKGLDDIQKEALGLRQDIVTQSLDLITAQADYNAALVEGKTSTADLAKQANELATKTAELDAAQQKANGGTQTAAEQTMIMMQAYNDLQKTLKPGSPLFNAIEAYKQALLTIPTNVRTALSITDAAGRPVASTGGAGGGAFVKTPDGERTTQDRSTTVNLNLNDRTLQSITVRADDLNRGTR